MHFPELGLVLRGVRDFYPHLQGVEYLFGFNSEQKKKEDISINRTLWMEKNSVWCCQTIFRSQMK